MRLLAAARVHQQATLCGDNVDEGRVVKILHVLEALSPRCGGPVSVVSALAAAQQRSGHEVTISTTAADHPRGTYHAPGWGTLASGDVAVFYGAVQFAPLRFSWDLAAYLDRNIAEFDVVHVHGLYRFPSTYAAWRARRQRVPYVITPHGSLDPYLYDTSSAGSVRLKRLYERWFDLPNLHAAGSVHYTAEEERGRASFLGLKARSIVIPNGLNWERYQELPARGALRARLNLGEAPTVLFLGRLHPVKALDLLIPAFDELRHRLPNARLVIAGPENDGYGQKVRGWVRDRGLETAVYFIGPLNDAEVAQAYADADVFALPSYTENFGMAVAEAMACALPVVISDQVRIHTEISGAYAGLVTRCDVDEVAEALSTLLDDPARRRSMGEAGRRLVQARYTWPAIVEALTREYQAIIDRKRYPDEQARPFSANHKAKT